MKSTSISRILPRLSARLRLSTAISSVSLLVALPHMAGAATYTVVESFDDASGTVSGTLSWAIANATTAGDLIEIAPGVTSITVTGSLPDIVADITITAGSPVEIVGGNISGTGHSLVLNGISGSEPFELGLIGAWNGTAGSAGTAGATSGESGTSGSAGGDGVNGSGFVVNSNAVITGGTGGAGGAGKESVTSNSGRGGDGGAGGSGLSASSASVANEGTITGGTGGTGGAGGPTAVGRGGNGGDGGTGGAGISGDTLTIVNSGTISGGAGGGRGARGEGYLGGSDGQNGSYGLGGAGISGSNLTVVNSGTISGGLSGNGSVRANAVEFSSGTNSLEIWAGSTILGNVVTSGSSDTLILGGAADGSFDLTELGGQYTGFENLSKSGASTWTASNTSGATFNGFVRLPGPECDDPPSWFSGGQVCGMVGP